MKGRRKEKKGMKKKENIRLARCLKGIHKKWGWLNIDDEQLMENDPLVRLYAL